MQPLPRLISFILFLGLCASLAYWAIEFFTPPPRPVISKQIVTHSLPTMFNASGLFGGQAHSNTMKNIQLHGVILAGRSEESVAIMVTEAGTPKYLRRDAEVMPGVVVQEIESKKVVLCDHGVSREVSLAAFTPASATVATHANTNSIPMPVVAVPQATGNATETGMPAVQNINSAGSSGTAAVTASGNGNSNSNSNRPPVSPNAAAAPPQAAP